MKTRKILAASTAALLAFGTTAIVASADLSDIRATENSSKTDFNDFEVDEWNDIGGGVNVKVTKAAKEKLKDYSLGGASATAATLAAVAEAGDNQNDPVKLTGGAFEDVEKTSLSKLRKMIGVDGTTAGTLDNAAKKIQFFDISVGYNSDADKVPTDAIKLKADVTVEIESDVDGTLYHMSSDGKTLEAVKASKMKNAAGTKFYYTFTTNSFSPYFVSELEIKGLASVGTAATDSDASDSSAATSDGATSTNPETGIALAIAPVVLAAGAVAVVALKKKH